MIVPPSASRFARIRSGKTLRPASTRPRPGERARGRGADERQRIPLRLPLPGGALVRPLHRGEQGAGVLGGEDAEADDRLAADRVRLLRHRRGGAAQVASLLAHLTDLGAGELDHLPAELAARRRRRGEDEPDLGDGVARGVPGNVDDSEPQPRRDARGERPGSAVRAPRPCRRRRTAGRRRPARERRASRSTVAGELGEPDGQLAAEGDRHRGLGVGPARHHRRRDARRPCSRARLRARARAPRSDRAPGRGAARGRCP